MQPNMARLLKKNKKKLLYQSVSNAPREFTVRLITILALQCQWHWFSSFLYSICTTAFITLTEVSLVQWKYSPLPGILMLSIWDRTDAFLSCSLWAAKMSRLKCQALHPLGTQIPTHFPINWKSLIALLKIGKCLVILKKSILLKAIDCCVNWCLSCKW